MSAIFGRMTEGVLAVLGEDALLRATVPCKINIEHGVQLSGLDSESAAHRGDFVVSRDVATVALRHAPKSGDRIDFLPTGGGIHAGRSYRLETKIEDNGYSARYTIVGLPGATT